MLNFFDRKTKGGNITSQQKEDREDREIVFSKSVKAGKRMYYLDIKRDRRSDLFLSITESKRKNVTEDGQFVFEKHKIFLYKEDFDEFEEALKEVLNYVRKELSTTEGSNDSFLE